MNTMYIVWGGQFGSEGKGQIAAHLTKRGHVDVGVRVGGPNAGHTFYYSTGLKGVTQTIPVPAMLGRKGYIGPAGMIIEKVLSDELKQAYRQMGTPVTLYVDNNAVIIKKNHMAAESHLKGKIGSTGEGVGAATAEKVMRIPNIVVSANKERLQEKFNGDKHGAFTNVAFGVDTIPLLNEDLEDKNVLLEGTQGFGLGLHTGGYYPFCTSRETTPMAILAETGANPIIADNLESIMVVRTFPIRVGGNSGDLPNEITWKQLEKLTDGYVKDPEITTVTKKERRIAHLDWGILARAVLQCAPTAIALTFLDYVFPEIAGAVDASALEQKHWQYINHVENTLGVPVKFVSTGPGATISMRVTI
jgi:adenylosuccinate synthase